MQYRKIPNNVEVIQYTGSNKREVLEFIGVNTAYMTDKEIKKYPNHIRTMRGDTITFLVGDYIVKDSNNEFYPLNADTFIQNFAIEGEDDLKYRANIMVSDLRYNSEKLQRENVSERDTKMAKFCTKVADIMTELLMRI